jgi:general secretion pathway protein E
LQLGELGLTGKGLEQFESLILRPEGTIILTGPSNSGKTTTIYSALEKIYAVKQNTVNIATIEDPVERDLRKFSQTQIVPARGLTFSSALRAVLRQDPNVIVVGEIRDAETANMAIRAGMTGHLVITTIHSGTAPGALARLMEMGIEPFILASSVSGVMAQRLVRKVCPKCAVPGKPAGDLLERFRIDAAGFEQQKGEGCAECAGSGYRGRTAIAELMLVDDALREAVLKHSSIHDLSKIAGASGMRGLLHDGLEKVAAGVTNLEELARVLVPDEG